VPTDAQLESAGAVIGEVELDLRNLFDEGDPRENVALFRLADRLHIRTKPATVRAQLLFRTGDPYSARKLAETERNLRALPYLFDAHIVPVRYHDGVVDVRVITNDVWTLSPGLSFGRAGGSNSTNINLQDTNLLGWGKDLEFAHVENVDRTSDILLWADPNVFGSRWTAAAAHVDSSDGRQRTLQLVRPFYELDARWSATVLASGYDRTVSRYSRGVIVDQFKDDESTYELSGGLSDGLQNGWVHRWLAGMHYDQNRFGATPGTAVPAAILPADRTLSYPFVGFDFLQDDYAKLADQNQIGKTEDFFFGTELAGQLGWSSAGLGADHDAVIASTKARKGYSLDHGQELFLTASVASRLEQGYVRNLIATGGATYYWRWRRNWLLYANVAATTTDALDADTQLLLGGDSGLRGYPLRYEAGTSRALATLEQRFYTDWYPFRLVRVGGAVFADVGRTWGREVVGNSSAGLLSDVGFGLRLGNTRSGLGNVLHIDLAFPLRDIAGISRVQFIVQTLQSY
jgi:hemolysin activation/secretion protein